MRSSSLVLFIFLAVSSAAPVSVTRGVVEDLEARAGVLSLFKPAPKPVSTLPKPVDVGKLLDFNKANGLNQAAQKGANAPLNSLANLAKTAITTVLSPGPKIPRGELEELEHLLRRGLEEELEARAGVLSLFKPAPKPVSTLPKPVDVGKLLEFNKANGLNQAAQKGANAPLNSLANLAKTAITTVLSPGPKIPRELEELEHLLRRGLDEHLEARAGVLSLFKPAPKPVSTLPKPVDVGKLLDFNRANGLNQAAQKGANAPLNSLANLAKTAITTVLSPGPKIPRDELEELEHILRRGLNDAMEHEARAGVLSLFKPAPKPVSALPKPVDVGKLLDFNKANGLNQAAQKGANAPLNSLANLAKTAITTVLSPGPKIPRDELEEIHYMIRKGLDAAVNELD
ncbi:hypothetical protein DL96DRAFT_1812924 [Flagelloscypha sp. PMI_526]|nr:hypothetical protein DL96DRAFT_1812924 [Flagelloscypha sp. PMI_526]